MKHFKLLLFAFTLLFSVSAIAAPTTEKGPKAKKERKAPAEKKDKKFVTVTYYYTPGAGGITNPANWSTTPQSCPSGTAALCSITFNTETYPLEDGKPSTDFLEDEIAVHQNDSPTLTSFTVNGVTYIRRS